MTERMLDLVVIGSGTAGQTVAHRCQRAGWSVAVVDSRPFGGTCAQRGCDPKKVLVETAGFMDAARRMRGQGITVEGARISWQELIRFKRTFTSPVSREVEKGFAAAGIVAIHGRARFIEPTTLQVGEERLRAQHVVIAAGARRSTLNIPGEEYMTSSTQFMELEELPARIAFIGGGYISFEFAHIAALAGSQVQIFHRGTRPLKGFDPDLAVRLMRASHELGIDIHLDAAASGIEKSGKALRVHVDGASGKSIYEADLVVHGAGRMPEIEDLDLEKAGVAWAPRGVVVNEYLQSVSNPAVYAAGDAAASGFPLTPVASLEGRVVAGNLLEGNHQTPDYRGIPTVVYTDPPLAAVGLSEEAARAQGLKFRVKKSDTSSWQSSRRAGTKYSGYKVLVEEGSGRILGAHLLGVRADEVINLFALAIRFGITAEELKRAPFSYPTHSSDVSYML